MHYLLAVIQGIIIFISKLESTWVTYFFFSQLQTSAIYVDYEYPHAEVLWLLDVFVLVVSLNGRI